MKKCNVYTRTGDCGQTSLVGGQRVDKACLRLEAYGMVDELNSHLGLLLTEVEGLPREALVQVQRHLFTVGAILATPADALQHCSLVDEDIAALEHTIDVTADGLPGWRGFTLPGGTHAAAQAHICRTVCRRTERAVCRLSAEEPVPSPVLTYLNRLSDYLYVLACRLNSDAGVAEELWKPRC